MKNIDKYCVVGGDLRQAKLAEMLSEEGYSVSVCGFDFAVDFPETVTLYNMPEIAIQSSKYIILPLPYTKDKKLINAPFSKKEIYIDEVLSILNKKHIVLGGKLDDKIISVCKEKEIKVFDYLEREELAIMNAIATVEGALQVAMEETSKTIHGSKCAVIGNGRIGKLLAKTLDGLGAKVTVTARKAHDLAYICAFGYDSMETSKLSGRIGEFDIVFNTVPHLVVDERCLRLVKDDVLIIDLASKPGGVDFNLANRLSVKTIHALSLPGKVAPISAGEYLKTTINNIIREI